jgi:hypothetical protein
LLVELRGSPEVEKLKLISVLWKQAVVFAWGKKCFYPKDRLNWPAIVILAGYDSFVLARATFPAL